MLPVSPLPERAVDMKAPSPRWWNSFFVTTMQRMCTRRAALPVALMLMLASCSKDSPTAPELVKPPVLLTNAASFAEMIADGQSRIIPSLPASAARVALASAFDELLSVLQKGEAKPVSAALERATSAVERFANALGADSGYEADVDVLRRSMELVFSQLMVDTLTGS